MTVSHASLEILYKDKPTGRYAVDTSKVISIGRSAHNDIRLGASTTSRTDTSVSRFHAAIIPTDQGRFLLQDLGSRNGTMVGPISVGYAHLVSGDAIRIGDYTLVFREETRPTHEQAPMITKDAATCGAKTRLAPLMVPNESELKKLESGPQSVLLLYKLVRTTAVQGDRKSVV